MQSLRQIGAGILLSVTSIIFVLGGLTLALVEGGMAPASANLPAENTPSGELVTSFPTLPLLTFTDTPQGPDFTATASLTPPPTLTNCHPPAGWQPIITQPSDTLANLAQTYRTTSELLRINNCLLNDQLIANSILYVPALPPATLMPCGAPLNWGYYTVAAGDTLYRISLLYRATVTALMQANCLNTSVIRAGQVLRVPNVATSTEPAAATHTPIASNTEPATSTYTPIATPTPTLSATDGTTETPMPSLTPMAIPTETQTEMPATDEVPSPTTAPSETLLPPVTPTPES